MVGEMPRYIDLDKVIEDVEGVGAYYSEQEAVKELCLDEIKGQPIADVVPRAEVEKAKQEVARDLIDAIICFIKSDKGTIYCSNYEEMFYHNIGVESTKNVLGELVEEFEKKYIGE
jgi:5'(3')-deoxyribonucleotidase